MEKKSEYIPPQFYSVDGVLEILSALENTNDLALAKEFPGALLLATRKEKVVTINRKLMQKLEMTAESNYKSGLLPKEDYDKINKRIAKVREKYEV